MTTSPASPSAHGALSRAVRRAARASARRPKTMIALWMALVVACIAAGATTGTKTIAGGQHLGDSGRADTIIKHAHLTDPAVESVLVRSPDAATTRAAAGALQQRFSALPEVSAVHGPGDRPALAIAGGRTVLVQAMLRGDPDHAPDHVAPLQDAVAAVGAQHPGVTLAQAGQGTMTKAINDIVAKDLQRAQTMSLPITLAILILAFGALVAASVPLLLGITSVAAAMGALGVVSQLAPMSDTASSLVTLMGLAVGVDYSLFYIRREREERRAGRGPHAALEATAATVGRAVLVSGLTVIVALCGLAITGIQAFTSMALGTIVVVAIAVIGSLTVLPAVLALMGDRVDSGRVPGLARLQDRRRARRAAHGGAAGGFWAGLGNAVTRRPLASFVAAVCVLAAVAVPALDLHAADTSPNSLPAGEPVMVANRAVERAFPGAPAAAQLVVTGKRLDTPAARERLHALGRRALAVTHGRGDVAVDAARDGRVALVTVPMPGGAGAADTVAALRHAAAPAAALVAPGARALVTGDAARSADFTGRLRTTTPIVIAFVLGLALVLLLAAFRSVPLAAAVMGLNLLSVGASYGVLVAVFQHTWAEKLLGFTSSGSVTDWLPLFFFVILFGLSMDYTVLVLERIREGRLAGLSPRRAAAEGVAATGGTVTSAAVVMVAVFAIFTTLRLLELKEYGVGLTTAILLDATIVRGVALPALVALLGERGIRVPGGRDAVAPARAWDDLRSAPAVASSTDVR